MSTTQVRIMAVGLLFLLIFLSGLWLSRLGKPYSTAIFTIHKLVGLATGVLLAVIVYQAHQVAPLGAAEIAAVVVTVCFFFGVVATGGLLGIDKPVPAVVLRLHQFIPVLAVLSTAGTLYLLLSGK